MKPLRFKEQNNAIAEHQDEYVTLPAFVDPGPKGEVVFCMGLTFRERIRILFTGKIWCCLMMFRDGKGKLNPVTPSFFTTKKSELLGKGV